MNMNFEILQFKDMKHNTTFIYGHNSDELWWETRYDSIAWAN